MSFPLVYENYNLVRNVHEKNKTMIRNKFYSFIEEQRFKKDILSFVNEFKNDSDKEILVIMGDWGNKGASNHLKNNVPTPNKKINKYLSETCCLMLIDEYNTSQYYNKTKEKMEKYIRKFDVSYLNKKEKEYYNNLLNMEQTEEIKKKINKITKTKTIHSILVSKKTENDRIVSSSVVNRDKNAALNMREIVLDYVNGKKRNKLFTKENKDK